jgi:hypothetical protein
MKNIFILPTDQPSRLVKIKDTFFLTTTDDIPGGTFYNVYITSDEEIRKNDYYIHNNRIGQSAAREQEKGDYKNCKKIILTTDPTLIADGVQSIDDEFLEWFVKNPTCEFIKVTKLDYLKNRQYRIYNLPQEEPKQETKYSEDEVRALIIKALTHNDYDLCGSLATRDWEIRPANFGVWFEHNKKR